MKKLSVKKAIKFGSLFGLFVLAGVSFLFAQEAAAAGAATSNLEIIKWLGMASGFSIGLAALGSGLGQGKMVASAMDGIARNPQAAKDMFVPLILGLAFTEALTIYALVFGFVFKLLVL
ncbi:MAG: F0F1 ATP synthase subunit C [Deltaproteobacteria bacterium CG11_big_fil_rev_8_21_14_0_20_45_16]|nr:MAG: F0F1 ATP synthase subunit C [Deltaproteobacteria bacterium CG11_big_fil_rev_8_21_14_0_20_45_16]